MWQNATVLKMKSSPGGCLRPRECGAVTVGKDVARPGLVRWTHARAGAWSPGGAILGGRSRHTSVPWVGVPVPRPLPLRRCPGCGVTGEAGPR